MNEGTLTAVSSEKSFSFEATTTEFLATIPAVEAKKSESNTNNSSNKTSESTVKLPESVGENPFTGKTFTITDEETAKFSSNTVEFITTKTSESYTTEYFYTYDAEKSVLYLALCSYSDDDMSYSSISEAVSFIKGLDVSGLSEGFLDQWAAEITAKFNTLTSYKYTISDSSLTLDAYFAGTLPSNVLFRTDFNSNPGFELEYGNLYFSTNDSSGSYSCSPTFKSDGTFSGTLYKIDSEEYTNLGTISGTYKTTGTGTSGCIVTLTFKTLPSDLSGVTTGTEYNLPQD